MEENSTESRRWVQKMKDALSLLSLEPIIFLQTFTWGLGSVIQQNLIIAKVCKDLGYSQEICEDINNHDAEDDAVQTRASQINMYMSILGSLPCMLVALFIGPWSDKNGRKPVMIIPMIGYILSTLCWLLNIYYMDWPANYLLVNGVFSVFGGFVVFLIGMYAYMADITSMRARTTRIGILDIFLFGGVPTGTFLSAYVFKYGGYFGIYCTILVIQILVVLCISVFIKDTRGPYSDYCYPNSELETDRRTSFRRYLSIIDINQFIDVFKVTFKKREYSIRSIILTLVSLMLINVTIFSDGGILYLYARKKFKWNEQMYTKFQTCSIIVSAIAAFIVMPFLSFYLKMHDAAVGILASCSKIVSLLITSVAWNGWVLFAGSVSGFISAFSSIVIRSMLSKCVTKAELGKIFSLLASLEAAVPLFAAPLFTYVYTHTLETWTGAVFIVQAGIFLLAGCGFLFVYLTLLRNGNQGFTELLNEEEVHQSDSVRDILREENTEHSH